MSAVSGKFWPCPIDELPDRRSLISEPLLPENVISPRKTRSLHAILCEALIDTQALLARLEAGVTVPRQEQREVARLLYVATRHQRDALAAVLELDGLE